MQHYAAIISLLLLFSPNPAQASETLPPIRAALTDLRITEIMYHPLDVVALNGDSLEYIELKNTGSTSVDLSGVAFTNGISYTFTSGATLGAGAFVVLASNAAEFQSHYGFAPFGDYTGRLDNAGEQLTLVDGSGGVILSFRYADRHPWPIGPDGAGFSLVPRSEAAGQDLSDPSSWRASRIGGSPGANEPAWLEVPPVLINEVLTHTDLPFKDAVELFNPTNETVDLSGWYLTDKKETPRKYKLPLNTEISATGYLVFDEDDFNSTPGVPPSFALSSFGDGIFLFAVDDQDNLTGYVRGFDYGVADNGVSFGRETWPTGQEELLPQLSETLGRENSGARIGPVVISEIMYAPSIGEEEFIELVNISSQTISLFDQQFPENTWRIEGISFSFPQNAEMGPQSIALVVPVAPAVFRAARGIPENVTIYGPYTGRLNNAGEAIQLQMPDDPDSNGFIPYFDMDQVIYSDASPWPASADAGGASLGKTNLDGLSNYPGNWKALENGGTPGFVDLGSVGTDQPADIISGMDVAPPYPNPFDQTAHITFTSRQSDRIRVKLYDILGRELRVLFDGNVPANGRHEVLIERGNLPSGAYFIRVESIHSGRKVQIIIVR